MEQTHANEHVRKLSNLDLPPPSAIAEGEEKQRKEAALRRVNSDIAKMDLEEPSRLSDAERRRREDENANQVTQVISSLQLPDPEAVGRAARRADGTASPARA